MSRAVVRSLLEGGEGTVAVPLALAPAARIAERDWKGFLTDPTQLANGLRDLVNAVNPDGVPLTSDDELLREATAGAWSQGAHLQAAQEAARRLRQTLGDRMALVAVLPGPARVAAATDNDLPAAVGLVQALGESLLAAGADVLLVRDEGESDAGLSTLANIARFHRALALAVGQPTGGLPEVTRLPLQAPTPAEGVVVTDEQLPRDVDFTLLEDWLDGVHG
ncbi:hypothetical protein [Modestobacter lapidis]|nr:hypothetical protein [Modestobacter lapidis]